jgi:hypothetical protein
MCACSSLHRNSSIKRCWLFCSKLWTCVGGVVHCYTGTASMLYVINSGYRTRQSKRDRPSIRHGSRQSSVLGHVPFIPRHQVRRVALVNSSGLTSMGPNLRKGARRAWRWSMCGVGTGSWLWLGK